MSLERKTETNALLVVPPAQTDTRSDMPQEAANAALTRRTLLQRGATAGMTTLLPLAGVVSSAKPAQAAAPRLVNRISSGDVAVLRFLAAAELIEQDLWQQYTELALNNPGFHDALSEIDDAFPQYSSDTTNDEQSHAAFINTYLEAIGAEPVSLDAFRVLPSAPVKGALPFGRLTNLTNLTVDTSWYNRYRSTVNPDFNATIPQIVNIVNRPAIPTSDSLSAQQLATAARVAVFHFPTIEQGGTSLYAAMAAKVQSLDALRIVVSIGPVEAVHFAVFHNSLEDIEPFDSGDGLVIPDIDNATRHAVMPRPCTFFDPRLPLCAVVRPTSLHRAGALAAANALINSNLFQGQSTRFLHTLLQLARSADSANN